MAEAERPDEAAKARLRVPRTMGRGVWTLLGAVAQGNGVALPPEPRCVHGFPLKAAPCGCTDGFSRALKLCPECYPPPTVRNARALEAKPPVSAVERPTRIGRGSRRIGEGRVYDPNLYHSHAARGGGFRG